MVFYNKKEEPSQDSSFQNGRVLARTPNHFLRCKIDTLLAHLHLTSYYSHILLAIQNSLH
ncbi:hypothetical protein BCE_5081 [Bacillus cereus ATCC 10987]|uniref:Uncharacterized protein n=1 Tax=Bacillus cereus (strain ATCC 10987 / NRS 248) TaxID=222523 RepID=Q72YE0_BACC1|nr:hypothetical protein BCE_5081 [Bacillus cereus ATCC 10987]